VSWAPIEGAVSYRMWRSVPPAPTAAVTLPNPQQNSYVDADVKSGSTYYYLVAGVNQAGIEGLRAGSTPVTATISYSPSTVMPPTVTASVTQQDPLRVYVSFHVADAVAYEIQRTVYSSPSADPLRIDYTRPSNFLFSIIQPSMTDPLGSQPYARSVSYAVRARLASGFMGPAGKAELLIPAATVTTATGGTTSTTGTTSYSGSSATGSTTLTVAALATLTTGATTSLESIGGTTARWLSLNDAIATVDASGTVTARAGGTTQVLAVSSSSDGSVRVVAIPVTVKP
jgi:alpha-amylase